MIRPEVLDAMVAAGCTAEQIAAAVKADQAKSSGAERQARYRANKKAREGVTSDERDVTRVTVTADPSPKERSPTPPKEITPSPEPNGSVGSGKARALDVTEFRAECADLDAERLDAIVKHRRAKRGQLTGLAARLFRSDAAACGLSLAEAVDHCISRNWITVKPEYFRDRQRPAVAATGPPKPSDRTVSDVLEEMKNGTWKGLPGPADEPDSPYIETSFHRGN